MVFYLTQQFPYYEIIIKYINFCKPFKSFKAMHLHLIKLYIVLSKIFDLRKDLRIENLKIKTLINSYH